jgi:hypothetical protein
MTDKISDFINSYDGKQVIWGVDDCTAWAAKWAELSTGKSIQLPDYSNQEQAHEIIDNAGGLVELIEEYLGFAQIYGEPTIGDIAVIETGRSGLVTVLMLQNGVAAWRADQGVRLFSVRQRHIKAYWKLNEK